MIKARTGRHAEVIESYLRGELSLKDVMAIHDISRQRIYEILQLNSISTRRDKRFSKDKIQLIIKDYNNDHPICEITKKYNMAPITVRKILVKNGIKIRRYPNESNQWQSKTAKSLLDFLATDRSRKIKSDMLRGKPSRFKGHHHSKEAKEKIGAANRGRKVLFARRGWHHNEKTRIKMRLSQRKRRQLEKESSC